MIDLKEIKDHFWEGYQKVNKIKPKWGKKEGALFNKLKKHCEESDISQEDLVATMDWYFGIEEDFELKVKHDFGNFYSQFNKYYLDLKDKYKKQTSAEYHRNKRQQEYEENRKKIDDNYKTHNKPINMVEKIRNTYGTDYPRFENVMKVSFKPKYICDKTDAKGEPIHKDMEKQCEFCRESQIHKMWIKMFSAGQEVFGREKMVSLYRNIVHAKKVRQERMEQRKNILHKQVKELTK